MAEITDRTAPEWVPTTDALASIPRDQIGPIPAEIRLGANVLMVAEDPPGLGETITVTMRLKVKRKAEDEGGEEGGQVVHFRGCKIITAWMQGQPEPPDAEADQPALFDDDGEPADDDDAERLSEIVNQAARINAAEDDGTDDGTDTEDGDLGRPPFSDAE